MMTTSFPRRLVRFALVFLVGVVPARAQFLAEPSDLPIGELYNVEIMAGLWSPSPQIMVSSEAFGIAGSEIDFGNDLGLGSERFGEIRIRLRPGRKHRFRVDYIPIRYTAQAVVERQLVFRGIAYDVGVPVSASVSWDAWRLGYEYDLIHRSRGYFGVLLEARYTDIEASIEAPFGREFTRARGPIPAIGGVLRLYPMRRLAIAGEFSIFRVPRDARLDEFGGEYLDYDFSAVVNVTETFGVQAGYRSLDLNVTTSEDFGQMKLDGAYFGALVRF
jgi:hypothetical protein